MTPIPAFIIGVLLPTLTGYLVVRALEYRQAVLSWPERLAFALIIGPTGTLWLTDLFALWTGLHIGLGLLLSLQVLALGICLFLDWKNRLQPLAPAVPIRNTRAKWLQIGLGILLGLSILKVIVAASVLTMQVPTFFDDSRDNWNLRAKMIVETGSIPLQIPNEESAGGGVASYPATIPLFKAWLVSLNGGWSEGLVNSLHLVWLAAAALLVGGAVARRRSLAWGFAAANGLLGLPLLVIHGLHAYTDVCVAVHVAAVILAFSEADQAHSRESFLSWLGLGIVVTALLPALKNEGLAIFFPSAALLLLIVLARSVRRGDSSGREAGVALAAAIGAAVITVAPWLVFKWQHGLTFGNAHAVSDSVFGWQAGVLGAFRYQLFSEGNWLILPGLAVGLLTLRWRTAFDGRFILLTVSCLWIFVIMSALFLFNGDLGHEALRQTGYGRAMVQVAVSWVLMTFLLLPDPTDEQA